MAQKQNSPQRTSARQRLREQQEAEAAQRRQRRALVLVGSVVLALALVVGGMWAISQQANTPTTSTTSAGSSSDRGISGAEPGYVELLQKVSAADLDAAGATGIDTLPQPVAGGTVQLQDGKPRILYVGAEYCPFCAVTRLPMTIALSRFGTFTGLKAVISSPTEPVAIRDIPSVTYADATYTSDYVTFAHYEMSDRHQKPLQTLSTEDQATLTRLAPKGIPWVYWGTSTSGTPYDGTFLANQDPAELTKILQDPSSDKAKAIFGSANLITAQICRLTDNKPAEVCNASGVQAAAKLLG